MFLIILLVFFVLAFLARKKRSTNKNWNIVGIIVIITSWLFVFIGANNGFGFILFFGIIAFIITGIVRGGKSPSQEEDNSIPNYLNWNNIYDSLKGEEIDVDGTLSNSSQQKAIKQFYYDYEKTIKAFSEEPTLQNTSKYSKNYILSFFKDFDNAIKRNAVTFVESREKGWFELRYKNIDGTIWYYSHAVYRKYRRYDITMWKGTINTGSSWLSYGLSSEQHLQYWRTFDNGTSTSIIDASRGQVK